MYISDEFFTSLPGGEREEKETAVYRLLDELGIPYRGLDHDRADTMEICELIEGKLGAEICKNLFLCNQQQTAFYLLMMPGKKVFKTKFLSKQINSARLSFAGPEHMERLLNVTPGSVSVFGLMNDRDKQVRLLIDKPLLEQEFIGCHPCVNTSVVKIRTADLLEKLLPALGVTPTIVDLPDPAELAE